jgi:DNA-directed RNA polymerase I subunit RPA49
MSAWDIDNIITHLAAMSLYIDGFESDIGDLSFDLRLDPTKAMAYFRELGCKVSNVAKKEKDPIDSSVSTSKRHRVAHLRIPLEFPKIAKGKAKGR